MKLLLSLLIGFGISISYASNTKKNKFKTLTHKQFLTLNKGKKYRYLKSLNLTAMLYKFSIKKPKKNAFYQLLLPVAYADEQSLIPAWSGGNCIASVHGKDNSFPCGPSFGLYVHDSRAHVYCVPSQRIRNTSDIQRMWDACSNAPSLYGQQASRSVPWSGGTCTPEIHGIENSFPCGPTFGTFQQGNQLYVHCVPPRAVGGAADVKKLYDSCQRKVARSKTSRESLITTLEENPALYKEMIEASEQFCSNQNNANHIACMDISDIVSSFDSSTVIERRPIPAQESIQ